MSLAKDLGYENIFGTEKNVYSSENLKLLCYIRLLKRNLVRPIIAQNLNLTTFEVDEVVRSGIEKGLFLNENKLTKYGEKLYLEIKKKSDFTKQKVEEVLEDIIYIPKTFRGKT